MSSDLKLQDLKWTTFALYIHSVDYRPIDELITNINKLLTENEIDFFYARLNEETPVVKVRVQIKNEQKNLLYKCLQNAFNNVSFSERIKEEEYFSNYRKDLKGSVWKKHGLIEEQDYFYENNRYGSNIQYLVEQSFVLSSKIIATALENNLSLIDRIFFSYYMNNEFLKFLNDEQLIIGISETWENYIKDKNFEESTETLKRINTINFEDFSINDNDYYKSELFLKLQPYFTNYNNLINQIIEKVNEEFEYIEAPPFSERLLSFKKKLPFLNVIIGLIHMNNIRLGIKPIGEIIFYRYILFHRRKYNENS